MKDDNVLTKIGEQFGDDVVALVRSNRAFTVTILRVDDEYAYVTMTGGTEETPVPLTGINIMNGSFLIKPTVDSLAVVQYADSAENQPFFVAFSDVDLFSLTVGESTVTVTDGLWEFNGGELGGITKAQELKAQLDKSNTLLNALLTVINGAPIPEPGAGAPSALQTALALAIVGKSLGTYEDIENEKITQ